MIEIHSRLQQPQWCLEKTAPTGVEFEPAAVSPELADRAHSPAMDVVQVSYQPTPIDDENIGEFCERWAHILAEACAGRLRNLPRSLPVFR